MVVVCRCCALVFGTSADSQEQEQVENCITSNDGETASPLDGEWDITTGLNAKSCVPHELQISNNIDPAGEYKVPLGLAGEASQPTDAAATGPSAQCQIPPPRSSREDSEERGIITAQRTPKPDIQDVKIGNEDLVMNTRYVQIEFLNQDHVYIGVDAFYEARFRTFGKPELDNAAAVGLPVEAKPFKDSGHVPPSVSEGSVPTFAMHVDKTKTTLVSSLEKRRTSAGEGAANLEQTPATLKNLQMENDSSDSLSQGSSSSSLM